MSTTESIQQEKESGSAIPPPAEEEEGTALVRIEERMDEIVDLEEETEKEEDEASKTKYSYDDMDLPPLRAAQAGPGGKPLRRIPGGAGIGSSSSSSCSTPQSQSRRSSYKRRGSFDSSRAGGNNLSMRNRSKSPSRSRLFLRDNNSADHHPNNNSHSLSNLSMSSLEEFVDPDILYDHKGFSEVDMEEQRMEKQSLHHSSGNLTLVAERLSEDTLEDVHAFSDLSSTNCHALRASASVGGSSRASASSVGGSTLNGDMASHVLAPLNECEDEDDLSDQEIDDFNEDGQVILTNMEKLTILENEPMLFHKNQDAPSLPTSCDAETLPTYSVQTPSVQTDAKTVQTTDAKTVQTTDAKTVQTDAKTVQTTDAAKTPSVGSMVK